MTDLTALVLTYNEEPNIARVLARLQWIKDVVVLDSCSTDQTCAIAERFPNVRVVRHAFTTLAAQWNYGLEQTGIASEWVLALDADYVLSEELIRELETLEPPADVAGYRAQFDYCVNGRKLRSGVYPPVTVLFRRTLTHVEQDGHCQRARVSGAISGLSGRISHDDRKPLSRWLASQASYMRLEADKLRAAAPESLATIDRLRQTIVLAPPAVFAYCLLIRGGLLDGWPGLFYAWQRATAESILSLTLLERYLNRAGQPPE